MTFSSNAYNQNTTLFHLFPLYHLYFIRLIPINEPKLFENIMRLLDEPLSPLHLDIQKCTLGNFQLKFLNHS